MAKPKLNAYLRTYFSHISSREKLRKGRRERERQQKIHLVQKVGSGWAPYYLPGTFSISLVFLWAFFLFLHVGHIFLSLHFARYSVCSNALEEGAASPSREKAASVRTACGVVWQAGCGWVGARSARVPPSRSAFPADGRLLQAAAESG